MTLRDSLLRNINHGSGYRSSPNSSTELTMPELHNFFSHSPKSCKWVPNRWANHAEILHSLWGILCAAFGKKKTDRVWSGHRAVTSWEEQPVVFLQSFTSRSSCCSLSDPATVHTKRCPRVICIGSRQTPYIKSAHSRRRCFVTAGISTRPRGTVYTLGAPSISPRMGGQRRYGTKHDLRPNFQGNHVSSHGTCCH